MNTSNILHVAQFHPTDCCAMLVRSQFTGANVSVIREGRKVKFVWRTIGTGERRERHLEEYPSIDAAAADAAEFAMLLAGTI